MAGAKTAAKTKAPTAALNEIPITHHAASVFLARAEAALDLLAMAEQQYEGESLESMRTICVEVLGDAVDGAKVAYAKAVGDKLAVEPAR